MPDNIKLFRLFQFSRSLLFWQAIWFLYFQEVLSARDAILLIAVSDLGAILLEVPSGYLSDLVGRRATLVAAAVVSTLGCFIIYGAESFWMLAFAQFLLGTGTAFVSGSDNAFLYDTLVADGRADDVAGEELISWRYQYSGLAVSAAIGGVIGYYDMPLAFLLSGLAGAAGVLVMLLAKEPPTSGQAEAGRPLQQLGMVLAKMRTPMLFWLFVHAVSGYTLSHVPFVFAQPYLRETLSQNGLAAETPVIAGLIVSAMMVASVLAGKAAPTVNRIIGNAGSFLLSKAIQIGLIMAMAAVLHPGVIPLLLIRMVPDALSTPYVLALMQPRLESAYRASYLSVQSLLSRLGFSVALFAAAFGASGTSTLTASDLSIILPWFAGAGIVIWVLLAVKRGVLED